MEFWVLQPSQHQPSGGGGKNSEWKVCFSKDTSETGKAQFLIDFNET